MTPMEDAAEVLKRDQNSVDYLAAWTAPSLSRLKVTRTLNGSNTFGDAGNHHSSTS